MNLQPTNLANEVVSLVPLAQSNFNELYTVASDPEIWKQHPVSNRYERDEFAFFFESAIQSRSAFLVRDYKTNQTIGSTRYYQYEPNLSRIAIGFTFLARSCWGGQYNFAMKQLMIDYAFNYVDTILFHIGDTNIRSQKATGKLGAVKAREFQMNHRGVSLTHFEYELSEGAWEKVSEKR